MVIDTSVVILSHEQESNQSLLFHKKTINFSREEYRNYYIQMQRFKLFQRQSTGTSWQWSFPVSMNNIYSLDQTQISLSNLMSSERRWCLFVSEDVHMLCFLLTHTKFCRRWHCLLSLLKYVSLMLTTSLSCLQQPTGTRILTGEQEIEQECSLNNDFIQKTSSQLKFLFIRGNYIEKKLIKNIKITDIITYCQYLRSGFQIPAFPLL